MEPEDYKSPDNDEPKPKKAEPKEAEEDEQDAPKTAPKSSRKK